MPRLRFVLLVGLMMAVAAACQVRSEVAIDVDADGSGTVTVTVRLDPEASRRLGDPATELRLDDLTDAGWRIAAPERVEDGGLVLVGSHDFASPDQLASVLDDVGGNGGVFRDVRLGLSDGFARTDYEFGATVELSGSLEQFSDPELTALLDGLPLARSPEELAFEGGSDPEAATLDVVVRLPGGAPETNGTVDGERARWSYSASGGTSISDELRSESSVADSSTRVLIGVGILLVLVAVVLATVGLLRRRG